jgi:PTH1 family peptidyl-tRNA hydrolase
MKRLIVGLGNPSAEYAGTRHNVGFAVADLIAEKTKTTLASEEDPRFAPFWGQAGVAIEAEAKFKGYPFALQKPLTYMNRSGSAVRKLMNRLHLTPKDVIVIYDDLALPVGAIRLRPNGSAAGHNGMQDIIDELGTPDIARIRIGIGNNFERGQQADYVLSPFHEEEHEAIAQALKHATDAALTFVREGMTVAMNRYNKRG